MRNYCLGNIPVLHNLQVFLCVVGGSDSVVSKRTIYIGAVAINGTLLHFDVLYCTCLFRHLYVLCKAELEILAKYLCNG